MDEGPYHLKFKERGVTQHTRGSGHYPQKSQRQYSTYYYRPFEEQVGELRESLRNSGMLYSPEYEDKYIQKQREIHEYVKRNRLARTTNLDRQAHKQAWKLPYNPNPSQGFFPQADKGINAQHFTSLDIETDDYGQPISISATKFYRDEKGQFRAGDTYQRYYKSNNLRLQTTYGTHGLTRGILNKRRKQQGATYSKSYDWREKAALRSFLRDSIIVGHNIHEFDLPRLGLDTISQSTIDTVAVARDMWKDKKNDLESVYKRVFGRTMAQDGFFHHDANADELATMKILDVMMRKGTPRVRASLQYIEQHPEGVHFGTYNAYIKSNLVMGNYNSYLPGGKGGYYMTDKETGLPLTEDGNPIVPGIEPEEAGRLGMHVAEDLTRTDSDLLPTLLGSFKEIAQHMGGNVIAAQEASQHMAENLNTWTQVKKGQLIRQLARTDVKEENRILQGYGGVFDNKVVRQMINKQRAYYRAQQEAEQKAKEEEEYWSFSRAKGRKLRHELRHGNISIGQFEKLSASSSWDKLIENLDKVTIKNEKYASVLAKLNSIPMYNFERWESAFTGQVGGIAGAFRNLAPRDISKIFSRFTDAGLNSMREQYAMLKYGVRAGSAVGPALMGAGLALAPVTGGASLALTGVGAGIKGASQIIGNLGEGMIVRKGEGIQNNLNTLAFLKDYALLPLKLFGDAIRATTRLFNKFTFSFRAMGSQLAGMSNMGNPWSEMTGAGYGAYMGSVSADYASLLGKGTINNIYQDMAAQRASLYTTGDLNVQRLVAASMLGVYDQVYGANANDPEQFTALANKLASDLKTQDPFQKKQTLMLANRISPQMAQILQTMTTLGISDFNQLKHPAGMIGYTEAAYNSFRPGWQRAQWEYSYGREQLNTTGNRLATWGWNAIGRRGMNYLNAVGGALSSALESGDWKQVGNTIRSIWYDLQEGAQKAWDTIKKTFGMSSDASFKDIAISGFSKIGVAILKTAKETLIPGFLSIWDTIVKGLLEHSRGFIDYLSTIKVDFKQLIKNAATGNWDTPFITSLKDETYDTRIKDTEGIIQLRADLRQAYAQKYGTYEGFESKYRGLMREEDMLRAMADFNMGDKDYLDYLVQSHNRAGAAYLHPKYGTKEDLASSQVNTLEGAFDSANKVVRGEIYGGIEKLIESMAKTGAAADARLGKENALRIDVFAEGKLVKSQDFFKDLMSGKQNNINVGLQAVMKENGLMEFVYSQSTGRTQ